MELQVFRLSFDAVHLPVLNSCGVSIVNLPVNDAHQNGKYYHYQYLKRQQFTLHHQFLRKVFILKTWVQAKKRVYVHV